MQCLEVIAFDFLDFIQVIELFLIVLPDKCLISFHGDGQSADRQMGGLELEEVILQQGNVEQVRGVNEDTRLTDVNSSAVIL